MGGSRTPQKQSAVQTARAKKRLIKESRVKKPITGPQWVIIKGQTNGRAWRQQTLRVVKKKKKGK